VNRSFALPGMQRIHTWIGAGVGPSSYNFGFVSKIAGAFAQKSENAEKNLVNFFSPRVFFCLETGRIGAAQKEKLALSIGICENL
jgi:hypothetical protein